jgi:hypothetical protein
VAGRRWTISTADIKQESLLAESKEIINIDDDGTQEAVVGSISKQQVKVFAHFSAAFYLFGLAATLSITQPAIAAAAIFTSLAFVGSMILETQRS